MTTTFQLYPITEITVNREERHRTVVDDLEGLKQSIATVGLLNPIIIDRDGTLIAGERRYNACLQLGLTSIPVQFRDDLPRLAREQIELDENIKRKQLSWEDEARAVLRFYEIGRELNPEWSFDKTANELGMSQTQVIRQVHVGQALIEGDPQVCGADRFSVAYGILERRSARASDAEENALNELLERPAPEVAGELANEVEDEPQAVATRTPVKCTDFTEWVMGYRGAKFNFIHCDFPYGIDADKHDQGAAQAMGGYEDTLDYYRQLVTTFLSRQDAFIAPSAHCMFWFSMRHYQWTKEAFEEAGWSVNYMPLLWVKSNNAGTLPDPKRGPRQIYETALLCSRGDRFIVRAKSNAFAAPTTKQFHMSEKNVDMLAKCPSLIHYVILDAIIFLINLITLLNI